VTPTTIALLTLLIFAGAMLYSSVGHAGASGYLAAMALFGLEPVIMKPTALCLNVLVATIGTIQFFRAGCFSWSLFWPFALASAPAAYVGGSITLPGEYYRPLVGIVLLFAATRLWMSKPSATASKLVPPPLIYCLAAGAGIGLLAGLTGTGGGIFLSPLMLFMDWADVKRTSGVSAAFILANSIAGLAGVFSGWQSIPIAIIPWAVAAISGGLIGSYFGSRRLPSQTMRRLLAVVLVIAGVKLVFVPN
jgi:uncharacterized membrane protein YfcA